jgi:CHAT domain-containing protein
MDASVRLAQLIAEYQSLDLDRDKLRLREIFSEAAGLVDHAEKPMKWAAFRSMYAQTCDTSAPDEALRGYRDALTVFTPAKDRDSWANCTMNVGMILALRSQHGTAESEEALSCLEATVSDYPWVAATLGLLYRFRSNGDLAENWAKRVQYQKLALSQIVADEDPAGWAAQQNELGLSATDEPGCNFAEAMPRRITLHKQALELLERYGLGDTPTGNTPNPAGATPNMVWIETCIHLCESYLFSLGDWSKNQSEAEQFGRKAVAVSSQATPDVRRRSRMSLGRVLARGRGPEASANLHDAIQWFELATQDCEPGKPELLGNIRALEASAYLDLMRLGEAGSIGDLARCSREAVAGFIGSGFRSGRRSALQVEAWGWVEAENFVEAARCLEAALLEGEALLAETVADSSRIERVFQLHDSSALLCYCRLKLGDPRGALEALDRGKARYWNRREPAGIWASLATLIPSGGALLFAVFAGKEGAVIVVTAGSGSDGPHAEPVWLENFGKKEMLLLQRGDPDWGKLGGWMRAYSFHRSEPLNWVREIERVAGVLYESVWKPVIEKLTQLGIAAGTELVWFPQGGAGVFPVHAGWTGSNGQREWLIDRYAIRFAPSAAVLLAGRALVQPHAALLVSNPGGDLKFSDLECAWARRHAPASGWQVFDASQATADAVLNALSKVDWAHFCTHARFDLVNPLQSSLKAAGGQYITLERLLPLLAARAPSVIVLSACETAMSRVTTMPDEFMGFPAALLDHGVAVVVATLWPVDDAAAAVLMGRFYTEFELGDCTAAEALRRSQSWLRTATVAKLRLMLGELRTEPGRVGQLAGELRMKLFMQPQDIQPFAEPYYWAAFTIAGKG